MVLRIIPAHAGKTSRLAPPYLVPGDHPRSRGENIAGEHVLVDEAGSSPLTRGKHPDVRAGRRRSGIIPAHAGKTSRSRRRRALATDHPRSRGENRHNSKILPRRVGSSPLTRGKRAPGGGLDALEGIIPAHAGKTICSAPSASTCRDHPRSRGENSSTGSRPTSYPGSSPLTRGKPPVQERAGDAGGIIPAHAGKTVAQVVWLEVLRDHPRSRGENPRVIRELVNTAGSSPLTRGKPFFLRSMRC